MTSNIAAILTNISTDDLLAILDQREANYAASLLALQDREDALAKRTGLVDEEEYRTREMEDQWLDSYWEERMSEGADC